MKLYKEKIGKDENGYTDIPTGVRFTSSEFFAGKAAKMVSESDGMVVFEQKMLRRIDSGGAAGTEPEEKTYYLSDRSLPQPVTVLLSEKEADEFMSACVSFRRHVRSFRGPEYSFSDIRDGDWSMILSSWRKECPEYGSYCLKSEKIRNITKTYSTRERKSV